MAINFFRKNPASIGGHESKIAELDRQIGDAESDLAHAEAASVNAALDGTGLGKATDAVVRAVAEVGALRNAKKVVEDELQALKAKAAQAAIQAKCNAASERVEAWKRHAEELRDKITPLITEADATVNTVNQVSGYLVGVVPGEMRAQMGVALAALAFTIDNAEAVLSFLARRDEDCANRVLSVS